MPKQVTVSVEVPPAVEEAARQDAEEHGGRLDDHVADRLRIYWDEQPDWKE